MRHSVWRVTAAAALTVLTVACSGDDGGGRAADTTNGGAATTAPAMTSPAASPTTTQASPTTLDTAPATTAAGGGSAPLGVGRLDVTFTDTTRDTPASRDQPATAGRVLDTVLWYPTGGAGPFPLVVFSHGLGGHPVDIEAIADDWVQAGFVVAAPSFPLSRSDHPGGPDAGDVQNQTGDVSFLIDTLTGDLDPASPIAGLIDGDRIGAAGHSNGAITTLGVTANSCCSDERIDAAIEISGTPAPFGGGEYDAGLAPPYLIVHGSDDPLVNYANAIATFNLLHGPKGLLTIEGGDHFGFLAGGPGHDDVVRATTDFWRAYLLGDTDALARLASDAQDPAVTIRFDAEAGSTDTIETEAGGEARTAVATPTSALTGGQRVTVTWSGFLPGGTVNIVQCSQGGTAGSAACDLTTGQILLADPTGDGSIELPIVIGAVGTGRCEAGITDCAILVNDSGLPDPAATILIPIDFAP